MEGFELEFGLSLGAFFFNSIVVTLVLVALSIIITRRLDPDTPGALQNAGEALVEFLEKPVAEHFNPETSAKVLPVLGSFFLFILAANWIGIVPLLKPPTADLSTTVALSISAVISFQVLNVMVNGGVGALKQFMLKPVPVIGAILKVIDNAVRAISLAVRLFGNLAGEHMVFEIVSGIVGLIFPVILMLLGTLVGGIQAVVFSMLSLNYLAEEIGAHEEEAHGDEVRAEAIEAAGQEASPEVATVGVEVPESAPVGASSVAEMVGGATADAEPERAKGSEGPGGLGKEVV